LDGFGIVIGGGEVLFAPVPVGVGVVVVVVIVVVTLVVVVVQGEVVP
jgi:hypothetical protein